MLRKIIVASAAAGALGSAIVLAATLPAGTAFAANDTPPITDFSAQPVVRKGPAPVQRVAPRVVAPGVVGPRVVAPRFVPRISPGARGASFVGGRQFFVNRGAYRTRYGGRIVTFVAIGAVAAVLVGGRYYQPYGYVEVEAPACTGLTDDGCELRLTEVPTEEGEPVPQCVQFCPPAE